MPSGLESCQCKSSDIQWSMLVRNELKPIFPPSDTPGSVVKLKTESSISNWSSPSHPVPPHTRLTLSLSHTLTSLVFSIASQPPCRILPSSCARLSTRQSYLLKGQGCCYWFLTSLFDQCSYERLRHHWALTLAQSPCHGQLVIFRQTRCQRVDVLFIILLNFCICIKFSASRTNNLFLKTT